MPGTWGQSGWLRSPAAKTTLTTTIVAAPLLLLLTPAIYYALDTPIGLIDRQPQLHRGFIGFWDFVAMLNRMVSSLEPRFRPFFNFWHGLQWKLFGDVAWLHHLVRWLMLFGAVSLFLAAFARVAHGGATPGGTSRVARVLPMALLAYLWLLFPTSIVTVRIECVELYTMFFLGVCNFAAALMLTAPHNQRRRTEAGHQALLLLGFVGLVGSKEVNVAPALWLVLCYGAFVIVRGVSWQRLLVGVALVYTLAFAVHEVSEALALAQRQGMYFASNQPSLAGFAASAADILRGLFLWETSPPLGVALALPPLGLLVAVGWRMRRRGIDGELAFIALLLGEAVTLFLVLTAQFGMTLRYWSVLVPCLATLLAFAAKFALAASQGRRAVVNAIAVICVAFLTLFVSANHYNFLYQVVIQHSERNLDDQLLARVAELLNAGEHLQAHRGDWAFEQVAFSLDSRWNHRTLWPDSPHGHDSLHAEPPEDPRQPYYILDMLGQPGWLSLAPDTALTARGVYDVLRLPRRVATLVQGGAPHVDIDAGFQELGHYRWAIHAVPHNMADHLQGVLAAAGERIGGGVFEVYSDGAKLTYVRRQCEAEDTADWFFLHFHPVDENDLPPRSKPHGFQNDDFQFRDWGVREGALCVAVRNLPAYPVKQFQTGQYTLRTGTPTWLAVSP